VAPQLGVGQGLAGRGRERLAAAQGADAARRGGQPEERAHDPLPSATESLVEARISARCTAATPARSRDRPPPMCIRHELSPATATSARVPRTLRILSASIAVEVSEFLSANV